MRYAVVLGSADCMMHDVMQVSEWGHKTPVTIIAVNDAGWCWPDVLDHWVSLHAENFPEWEARRLAAGYSMQYETWSRPKDDGYVCDYRIPHWGVGTSGLFAVTVAFHLGIDRVVLCGVPMEARPYAVAHGKWEDGWPESEAAIHQPGWEYHYDRMKNRVRSCSGWTRELLGAPTEEWLHG